jgi:sugar diacid utilization regulator
LSRSTVRRPGRGGALTLQPPYEAAVEVHAEVDRILDALAADLDGIAAEMVATIISEIPAYGRPMDAALPEDVRAHCAEHAALMVRAVRDDREPRREELDFARRAAARRVRQGVPLEALLQAFRLGHRTVWDAIVRVAADSASGREAALSLARPAMQHIDLVSTHVAESYLKEEQRLLATADRERRDLLENLLAGRTPAPADIPAAAAGIEAHERLLVAVARMSTPASSDPNELHRAADVLTTRVATADAEPLVVVRHGEIVAVIPAGERHGDPLARIRGAQTVLAERRAMQTRIGTSAPFEGLGGVAQGYLEARQALLRTSPERSLVSLEELSTFDYLVATADPVARQVAGRTSAALAAADPHHDGTLSETVMAYVNCDLDVGQAAGRLGVHPNTVRYRLRRVADITGRDPSHFNDLVELTTVIRMARART